MPIIAPPAKRHVTLGEIVPRYLAAREKELRPKTLSEVTRYLEKAWVPLLGNDDHGHTVKLLILTGQRRTEIGDLAWPEIDNPRRQIELPEHRTKSGRPHIVPLSDEALVILDRLACRLGRDLAFGVRAAGFGSWSKSKAGLDARIAEARGKRERPMSAWTLHDLRRSLVTHISEHGFAPPHVVEAIVNHISGAKAGVAGIYNRANYLPEKRRARELWGAHVAALVVGRNTNVVSLGVKQGAR